MKIAIINQSTVVTPDEAKQMTEGCGLQVNHHLCPAWGRSPIDVTYFNAETDVPPDYSLIALLDDPDHANALGYHSESPTGRKYGRVFAKLTLKGGGSNLLGPYSTCSVLSHEVTELAIDPGCNIWVDGTPSASGNGASYAMEVADPVQGNSYEIPISSGRLVTVSDFVFPEWFDLGALGKQVDYMSLASGPFSLANGYCIVRQGPGSETPIWGMMPPADWDDKCAHPASRTFKRCGGISPAFLTEVTASLTRRG